MVDIVVCDSAVLALITRNRLVLVVAGFWVEGDDIPSICEKETVSPVLLRLYHQDVRSLGRQ